MFQYPLTLIEAGSGFGKTTAVREFLNQIRQVNDCNSYWYTCLGRNGERTWKGICSLFGMADSKTSAYLEKLSFPNMDNYSEVAQTMEYFSCNQQTVLVIDNFQIANFESPLTLLDALSMHGCPRLHIIVITQNLAEPDLRTTHNPNIYTIENKAFCFTKEDIIAYFKHVGLRLTDAQAQQVFSITEGWIAAIRLQMLHFESTGEFDSHKGITTLIEVALWNRLNKSQGDWLVSISVIEDFTASQAATMLLEPVLPVEARRLLESNAFVSYQESSGVFTFHNLLIMFLQGKFNSYPEDFKKNAWRRAGDACVERGNILAASQFYMNCGDYEKLLSIPLSGSEPRDLVGMGGGVLPQKLLYECDTDLLSRFPEFLLQITLEMFLQGNKGLFTTYYKMLSSFIQDPELYEQGRRQRIAGELTFVGSFIEYNDIDKLMAAHSRAYELLQSPSEIFSYTDTWTFAASSVVYMFWRDRGKLWNTLMKLESGMPCYYELANKHGTGAPSAMKAEVLLLSGNDTDAEALCYKTLYQAEMAKQDSICFCAELILGRIAVLRGDKQLYDSIVESLKQRAMTGNEINGVVTSELCRAFLEVTLNMIEGVPSWLYDMQMVRQKVYALAVPFAQIIHAGLLLRRKDIGKFSGIIGEFLNETESLNMLLPKVYYYIYLSAEKQSMRNREDAMGYLKKALDIALPDKVYLPFAEHIDRIEPVLQLLKGNLQYRGDIDAILNLGTRYSTGSSKLRAALVPINTGLTPREHEIALLLSQGFTAKQIGEKLYISHETVRWATKIIYSKLGVHSKVQLTKMNL